MKALLLAISILVAIPLYGKEHLQFLHFNKSNNFPFSTVSQVIQDSHGFLWIGGNSGLARYDGYTYEIFTSADKKRGLPSNRIFTLLETSGGHLLVGTNLGLVSYNRAMGTFRLLSYSCTPQVCEDSNGQIWIATFDGIDVRDANTLELKRSYFSEAGKDLTVFKSIAIDKHNRAWAIADKGGLYVFCTAENTFVHHIGNERINNIEGLKKRNLVFDKSGLLWVGTEGNGLLCYDTLSKQSKIYQHVAADNNSIGSNNVVSMYADKDNKLWIACQYGYLNTYNRSKGNFDRMAPEFNNARSINAYTVNIIGQDNNGNYWIGTDEGLYCLNKVYNNFQTYIQQADFYNKSSIGGIMSFAELNDKKIAMATNGNGIQIFNPSDNSIKDFVNNNILSSKNIMKLIKHGNYLWGASWGGGIFRIDLSTNKVSNFTNSPNNNNSIISNNAMDLYATDTALIIGSFGEGIAFYNFETNKFSHRKNAQSALFDPIINNWINNTYEDTKGNLWISTYYGLNRISGGNIAHYGPDSSANSVNSFDVLSTFEDSRGQLWVLTSQGLDIYDYEENNFRRITEFYSMPNGTSSITEDDNGYLWVAATDLLLKISTESYEFKVYDKNDGIVSGEFKTNSVFKSSDGSIYFGSSDGFMKFRPSDMLTDTAEPRLYFRNLYINYAKQQADSLYLSKMLEVADKLELNYSKDIVSIEVAAINLCHPSSINYSYTFNTEKDTWFNLGKERIISFTSLNPGKHTLTVRASHRNGKTVQKQLAIIIYPKWWMTWWFRVLLAAAISLILVKLFFMRVNLIKEKNILLEKIVAERTSDLHDANLTLSGQSEKLKEQNHDLLEKQTVIEIKNQQLEEALDSKDKLIGIIAHDFKNPLFSILILVNQLKSSFDSQSDTFTNILVERIQSATHKLNEQMLRVLEWSASQLYEIDYKPIEISIETIIEDSVLLVKESSKLKNISIASQYTYTHNTYVDPRMLSTVMRNLLINAIKFTPSGGKITIIAQEHCTGIEVNVIDSGIGISDELIAKFANSCTLGTSTSGTEHETGDGLGLHICKEFVLKNNGQITAKSKEGEGTIFTITLPKGVTAATKKQAEQPFTSNIELGEIAIEANKNYTVLVIDDEIEISSHISNILDPYFTVLTAENGNAGLKIAQNLVPNLIISDVNMPLLNGLELCEILKKDEMTSHIPVMIITSMDKTSIESKAYIHGAADFIEKPFNNIALLYKANMLLNKAPAQIGQKQEEERSRFVLPEAPDDALINKIIDLLNQNLENPNFDVESIASSIGISRTQLWRKTKSILGKTPTELTRGLRLKKAAEMLVTSNYRVSDIAYNVGYNDPKVFFRNFTNEYGMSPTDYRKKQSS
jgi:ligand-binding sensor domain-containing protein/signal transduction histidine kinase/AraC-like DNA-binding protein